MITLSFTSKSHKVSFLLNSIIIFANTLSFLNLNFTAQFSVRENLLVVAGNPETKDLKEMMPDILKQVGPQ